MFYSHWAKSSQRNRLARISHNTMQRERDDATLPGIWTPRDDCDRSHRKGGGRHESTRSESAMSSPEELTFVVGRWLCGLVFVLDVVRRLKAAPTSSREQVSTRLDH
jgi:hypothetical protein